MAFRELPERRLSHTQKVISSTQTGSIKLYVGLGFYQDGTVGEVFINGHREGDEVRALMNALAIMISTSLQHGESVESVCHSLDKFPGSKYLSAISYVLKHPYESKSEEGCGEIVLYNGSRVQ